MNPFNLCSLKPQHDPAPRNERRPALIGAGLSLLILGAAMTAGCLGDGDGSAAQVPATQVLRGGRVVTMDAQRRVATAVALQGDRIVAVGSDADMARWTGASTKVVELAGRTVLPGFVDAHIHPVLGAPRLGACSMDGEALSADQVVARASTCLAADGGRDADWFEIVNVNPAGLVMTKADLDRVSRTRPILAGGIDAHTSWANTLALQLAGITADTPDPTGGVIVRDARGEPTGSLLDAAQALVADKVPPLSRERLLEKTAQVLDLARSKGITSLQDALATEGALEVYDALEQAGRLKMRVRANLASRIVDDESEYRRLIDLRARYADRSLLRADGVKIAADGVIEYPTQTAAMIDPYLDADGRPTTNRGGRYFEQAVLETWVARLDREGFRINVHAIGDYTTRAVLTAFEKARAANGRNALAHQISHLQVVSKEDLPRLAKAGVMANLQMFWALPDEYTVDALQPYISEAAYRQLYPAGGLARAGATLIGGSDWPIDAEPGDPMPNTPLRSIYMGVMRLNPQPGAHQGQVLNADERVDRDTMVAAYTINAARGIGLGDEVGSIEVGKRADLVLFDEDPTQAPIERLYEGLEVAETLFAGETVYRRPTASSAATSRLRSAPPLLAKTSHAALLGRHAACAHGH